MNPGLESLENPFSSVLSALPDTDTLIWLLFFLILTYTIIHAVVFVYHWFSYNIAPPRFLKATYVVYFAGIFIFIGALLASTIAITG